MIMRRSMYYVIALVALVLASCSKADVELCYTGEHPHAAIAQFTHNWGSAKTYPDTMFVIANRYINSLKYGLKINSSTGYGSFTYNSDVEEAVTDGADANEFKLHAGEYKFMSLNMDTSNYDYSSVYDYLGDPENNVRYHEVSVSYKAYELDDPKFKTLDPDWHDYNHYSQYIQTDVTPIYLAKINDGKLLNKGRSTFTFTPSPVTQRIEIGFNIRKVGNLDFSVDSVIAEMSGIPHSVDLQTGYLGVEKTYKKMFKVSLLNQSGGRMKANNYGEKLVYGKGVIDVTGIVGNDTPSMTIGPGIMQVVVYIHSKDKKTGKKHYDKVFGKINLYNTIHNAKLTTYCEDGEHLKRTGRTGKLIVKDYLNIDGKSIVETPEDNGIDKWSFCGDIIVDI